MDKAISILSGGMDSAVSTSVAMNHHHVSLALTYDYNQRAASEEIRAAASLCKGWGIEHKVINLKMLSEFSRGSLTSSSRALPNMTPDDLSKSAITKKSARGVWVPNRNGVFINIAAAIAEGLDISWIITGFNKEEARTFPDNSRRFMKHTNRALAFSTLNHPQLISYVSDMDKTEILKVALDRKIEVGKLWVCYDGGEGWCGRCESCARTIRAMQNLGILDNYRHCLMQNMQQ